MRHVTSTLTPLTYKVSPHDEGWLVTFKPPQGSDEHEYYFSNSKDALSLGLRLEENGYSLV